MLTFCLELVKGKRELRIPMSSLSGGPMGPKSRGSRGRFFRHSGSVLVLKSILQKSINVKEGNVSNLWPNVVLLNR
jgi:hypothetical protein